jgi:SAM-dependent methyltransferase
MSIGTKPLQPRITVSPKVSQRHLGLVLAAELSRINSLPEVRILDMGCGDGSMLAYLAQFLPSRFAGRRFDLLGFEVGDIGWQGGKFLEDTLSYLRGAAPEYPWSGRLSVLSIFDEWPYETDSFDVIISNQVFEHIQDHAFVFRQIRRCLKAGGVSIHLFPVNEVVYECHAHMPIVHWIRNPDLRRKVMAAFARLGFKRKYYDEMELHGWKNVEEFSRIYSEVIGTMTNYKSEREIRRLASQEGLVADFSFSSNFFTTKLLCKMHRPPQHYGNSAWLDAFGLPLFKRVASITLSLRHE